MKIAVAKVQTCSVSVLLSVLLTMAGCNTQQSVNGSKLVKDEPLIINSDCQYETVFDDSIPARVSYFDYTGKKIKFVPDPDHFWQSTVAGCFNTNQGLIIIGLDRNHPAESVAQMTLSTYLYKDNKFISKKYLNQAWSCMPDHSRGEFLNKFNLTINIKCKDKKEGNENITSSFDQKFSIGLL
ncbi:hypothetical protein [Psychrobacter pulmonis]|uniref:hypothetical protein n=1 Tax=Psychrobacter pulmonis TaxID=228654 RepID=UPI001917BB8D|nr:hypothetical protein [Psychrobacter pulmonis]